MDFNIAASFYFAAQAEGRLASEADLAHGLAAAASSDCKGLLRYGRAAGDASAEPGEEEEEEKEMERVPCVVERCRRLAKPRCRGAMCGHCCVRVQRRRLEGIVAAFAVADAGEGDPLPAAAADAEVDAAATAAAHVTTTGIDAAAAAAEVAGALCPAHKIGKKWLPPALRPPKQRQQHNHNHTHNNDHQQQRPPYPHPERTAAAAAAAAAAATTTTTTAAAAVASMPLHQEEEKQHGEGSVLYRSRAKVVLLGIGADEQLAGYGRHRSAFNAGGQEALARELAMDLGRLWTR